MIFYLQIMPLKLVPTYPQDLGKFKERRNNRHLHGSRRFPARDGLDRCPFGLLNERDQRFLVPSALVLAEISVYHANKNFIRNHIFGTF